MSKKPISKRPETVVIPANNNTLKKLKISLGIIIATFAFILYAQSISFNYAYDDHTITKDNRVVKQGFAGVPTLLKTDYWYGYNREELRGAIYRPATLIVLAIEWQLFPDNPNVFHLINVLLYSLLCLLIFILLCEIFKSQNIIFPFVCTVLYTAHPIHTEVVDNIKSIDEILCFLFSIISMIFALKYISNNKTLFLALGATSYLIGLLSKETAITCLAIIPLTLFLFSKAKTKNIVKVTSVFTVVSVFYLILHYEATKNVPGVPLTLLGNSLLATPNFISREITAILVLLKYIFLLIIPHPLSYDYSYSQIPNISITEPLGIIAIIVNLLMVVYGVLNLKKNRIISFGILFYFLTISPVSNIFLIIGSNMAERFLFMPSLGFCIILTFLLMKILKADNIKNKTLNLQQFFGRNHIFWIVIFIITGLYSIKTFSRSKDWKDSLTLFSHDVEVVDNSEKAHYNLASVLLVDILPEEKNKEEQLKLLNKIVIENKKAISICNNFSDSYFNLGVAYYELDDLKNALENYEKALKYGTKLNSKAYDNIGKIYGRLGQFSKAISMLDSALKYNPTSFEIYNDKGTTIGQMGNYKNAIPMFLKAIDLNPDYMIAYRNAGFSYQAIGDTIKGKEYLEKANRMSGGQQK